LVSEFRNRATECFSPVLSSSRASRFMSDSEDRSAGIPWLLGFPKQTAKTLSASSRSELASRGRLLACEPSRVASSES
jgi:hypothetical protein